MAAVHAGPEGALMAIPVTRRDVTAALALSCLSGVVRGHAVSARERGASPAIGDRVNRLDRELEELRGTLKIAGCSAAVVKDQRLLWGTGFGSSACENE